MLFFVLHLCISLPLSSVSAFLYWVNFLFFFIKYSLCVSSLIISFAIYFLLFLAHYLVVYIRLPFFFTGDFIFTYFAHFLINFLPNSSFFLLHSLPNSFSPFSLIMDSYVLISSLIDAENTTLALSHLFFLLYLIFRPHFLIFFPPFMLQGAAQALSAAGKMGAQRRLLLSVRQILSHSVPAGVPGQGRLVTGGREGRLGCQCWCSKVCGSCSELLWWLILWLTSFTDTTLNWPRVASWGNNP